MADRSSSSPVRGSLEVRCARLDDVRAICDLSRRVYEKSGMPGYHESQVIGQIHHFPEGQFVVTVEGRIIAYCGTFIIPGSLALQPHTWAEITGGGYASRHDPDGDYLYGMEVCVDKEFRGLKVGQRLYNERKKLCLEWNLKGIVFGGRVPTLSKRLHSAGTVQDYIQAVTRRQYRDPILSFQLRNGFEVVGILPGYLPSDRDSLGYAAHLLWRNPRVPQELDAAGPRRYGGRLLDTVRVATVQYEQRRVASFEEFLTIVEYFLDVVADYKADFVVFPELFSLQLLSIENQKLSPADSIMALTRYAPLLKERFREMAIRHNVNFIAGSHPTLMEGVGVRNICNVFLRDGSVYEQAKIHPTPNEVNWWNIQGSDDLMVIPTDCGPVGILICYDCEFPELGRHLVDQGAQILFVPFCTDERQSYLRVRYCAQARAVENQCYVVLSGNVGNLPRVANMDIQYAQSCILTPCDFPFSRDGIAADTTPNVETVAFADLRLDALRFARSNGSVQNLKDRRHDLYRVRWTKKPVAGEISGL